MCHVTAGIKKLLVLNLVYLAISGHPSISLMAHPFLYLWHISHLFLCDGITICLSVTTVICISVTVFTFFFVTRISYLSVTGHSPTCLQQNIRLCVCDKTSIYLSVKEHPSVFLWYNFHLLLQTKALHFPQNHLFSVSDFNSVIVMWQVCVGWGSNSHIFSP
jgi:hypothetical protein